jgi:hypothetical protein
MKKKILIFMIATAVVALAGWNISQASSEVALSDMALENVEALAQESGGSHPYQSMGYCYGYLNYMCVDRVTAESCRHHCP